MIVKIEGTDVNPTNGLDRISEGSLNIKKTRDKKRSMSVTLFYKSSDTLPSEGQDVQIYDDTLLLFGGIIKGLTFDPWTPSISTDAYVMVKISSDGYNSIPTRRTTEETYINTDAGTVVNSLITTMLTDEGITAGTISTGSTINSYATGVKSAADILDELADAAGYYWNINDDKSLDFASPSTLSTSTKTITEGDSDHFGLSFDKTLSNYRNKQFVVGGTADDPIVVSTEDSTAIAARAAIESNSGVYGSVYRDTNIQDAADATAVATEMLNRYKNLINVSFKSYDQFDLGKVMTIDYSTKYNISASFLITTETIKRKNHQFIYSYKGEARDITNYSSKQKDNAIDFFKKLSEGGYDNSGGGGGAIGYILPSIPIDLTEYESGDLIFIPA